jgi:hypothetical protein
MRKIAMPSICRRHGHVSFIDAVLGANGFWEINQ